MSVELKMLLYSVVLGLAHVIIAAQFSTSQRGFKWNMSSRDGKTPELTGAAARIDRASKNFLETFPFFAAAVLLLHASQVQSSTATIGAQLYFYARLAYLPVYGVGIQGLRSLIWLASIVGLVMVLAPLFGV